MSGSSNDLKVSMTRHPLFWLPNLLTVSRCMMGGVVAFTIIIIARHEAGFYTSESLPFEVETAHRLASTEFRQGWASLGFIVFAVSAFTDWLDGFLARKWNATSRFGRLADPIADKLIVGLPLLAIAWAAGWTLPILLPVAIIIIRDVLITGLRFAGFGANAMAVSYIAKFKTFLEMLLVALFLIAMALLGPTNAVSSALLTTWLFALWGVAVLSAWTGIAYILRMFTPKPVEISVEVD